VIHQAEQRVYEWRASFGSAAVTMVNYFFESNDKFKTTELCQEFADYMLEHDRFIFSNTDSEDYEVSQLFLSYDIYLQVLTSFHWQEWRGAFGSPFVLQVFATHLSAIRGNIEVPKLGAAKNLKPNVALALSGTAVNFLPPYVIGS
jgi:hypothetical protein